MEVILREDVNNLGRRGDIVKVAEGYGRNFLLPRGKAVAVNAANKAMVEKEKKAAQARAAKEKGDAEDLAKRIAALRFVAPRKVGENEQLYGS
ncbi:MAG TPA: 50S ribosomal protein L9, partial [Vicinamibacteria bacterium]